LEVGVGVYVVHRNDCFSVVDVAEIEVFVCVYILEPSAKHDLLDVERDADIEQVEFGTWLEVVYTSKDFDLSYVDHAEAFDFVNYTHADYYFGYDNPEVQSLYDAALKAGSLEEMSTLLAEAARIVAEDAPAKWLYNYTPTNA